MEHHGLEGDDQRAEVRGDGAILQEAEDDEDGVERDVP